MRASLITAILICVLRNSNADCPMVGDSKKVNIAALDLLKNRIDTPAAREIVPTITLQKMLQPGDDTMRFNHAQGATITGYVVLVERGGLESCNCHSKTARDWHIEISDKLNAPETRRVVVEVTPRFNIPVIPKQLVGRKVQVTGWMFFDAEHKQNSFNTEPKGTDLWRATAWEIHPVTLLRIVGTAYLRPQFPPRVWPPDRWLDELNKGYIDASDFRSLVAGEREISSYPFGENH